MAHYIENIQEIIKEEVIYAGVDDDPGIYPVVTAGDCFVPEDGSMITGGGVQCQEIVIDTEEVNGLQKYEIVETDGTFANVYEFDQNCTINSTSQYIGFTSGSESSPLKRNVSQASSYNSYDNNNYLQQSSEKAARGQTLREKQLELDNIKQYGSRQRSIKHDQEEWCLNSRSHYDDEAQMGDDDYEGDYEYRKKNVLRLSSSGRMTKPKKRVFAHRLQWQDHDMKEAMKCVKDNKMTIRGAAKAFNVPYSTLKDRVRGRVTHGTKPGVKTVLSPEEEQELVRFIENMERYGFNLQCIDIREKAGEILDANQRQTPTYKPFVPGHNWLSGFTKRHPGVATKRPIGKVTPPASMKMRPMLKRFFDIYSQAYRKLLPEYRASHIYSMTLLQPLTLSKTVTIIISASADGTLLPPYVLGNFDRVILQQMHQVFPAAAFVSGSDIHSKDKLLHWFKDFFVRQTRSDSCQRPCILFLNQPIRNISIRLVKEAIREHVSLICMPDILAQALQPLNSSLGTKIDESLKKCLKGIVPSNTGSHLESHPDSGPSLTGLQVAQLLKRVFDKSEPFKLEIKKNFGDSGIFPLNHRAVSLEKIDSSSVHNSDEDYLGGGQYGEGSYDDHKSFEETVRTVGFPHGRNNEMQDQGGLQLLSELSTAVRTPPEPSRFGLREMSCSSNQVARHPSAVKYRSSLPAERTSKSRYKAHLDRRTTKRLADRGTRRWDGDDDDWEDGERPSKIQRTWNEDLDEASTADSFDGIPDSCSRTRPIHSNRRTKKEEEDLDAVSNDTASESDAVEDERRMHYINDADVISQAVASILPKEELYTNAIRLPAPPAMKTPKLQYFLRKPNAGGTTGWSTRDESPQTWQTPVEQAILQVTKEEVVDAEIQEEVITTDVDGYLTQHQQQVLSEETTVEEVVMDDIETAIYDEEPAPVEIDATPDDVRSADDTNKFLVNYSVSFPLDDQETPPDADIVIENETFKANQMVRLTIHLQLNNTVVQIIRVVMLREALQIFQKRDPKVIQYNLEIIR